MSLSESLSYVRVIDDYNDTDSERTCLSNTNIGHKSNTNYWIINCAQKASVITFATVIMLLLIVCAICLIALNSLLCSNNNCHSLKLENNTFNASLDEDILVPLSSFEEAVMVDVNCGKVIGTVEDGAFAFKGIPYALPPIGTLRWSRPIPLSSDSHHCHNRHNEHRRVKQFASKCVQLNPMTNRIEGSEDCLYLNVWTPRLDDSSNLEVMVWFHGGLLHYGSGHTDKMRPSGELSRDSNTVFVSFNYRLQAMGFLALDLLANYSANSSEGNYGVWDALLVLQWIGAHIQSFGGDPTRVTLFGTDGGAAIILAVMTITTHRSLFRSVWLTDPAVYLNRTFTHASHYNHNHFLSRSGCSDSDVECLYRLEPQSVIRAFAGDDDPSFVIKDQNDLPIQGMFNKQLIVIDDELVTTSLPFPADTCIDIPVLIGSSMQAISYWTGPRDLSVWSWSNYNKYVTTSLDSFGPRLTLQALQHYPPSVTQSSQHNTTSPAEQYTTMVSDLRQICPINLIASNLSSQLVSPVYRYLITARPSKPISIYDSPSNYSFHMWDIIAFFDTIHNFIPNPSQSDLLFRDRIREIVFNFVRDGKSLQFNSVHSSQIWHQSFPHQMAIISNNNTQIIEHYVISDRCEFWHNHGLTKYVWIS